MPVVTWSVFGLTTLVALIGWREAGAQLTSVYRLFPLLGLLAFSTMWGHYVAWSLRVYSGADPQSYGLYSRITSILVLVLILLHPLLLILKLQADGAGLPPASYAAYVAPGRVGFVYLGMLSLGVFLLYETKKWLKKYRIIWQAVLVANHLAMFGIIVHALSLGSDVQSTFLYVVWYFYGISLLAMFGYLASKRTLLS